MNSNIIMRPNSLSLDLVFVSRRQLVKSAVGVTTTRKTPEHVDMIFEAPKAGLCLLICGYVSRTAILMGLKFVPIYIQEIVRPEEVHGYFRLATL